MAQVLGKAGGRARAREAAERAAGERQKRHADEDKPRLYDAVKRRTGLYGVDKVRGDKRDEDFDKDLKDHENKSDNSRLPELTDAFKKLFYHLHQTHPFPAR